MGGGPEVAAGGLHSAGDRDGNFFGHTVLWNEVCARRGRGPGEDRRPLIQLQMTYFVWTAGIILALAWASRIVDAALGMPSVADVSLPEWDLNPVLTSGNPRVSIIVPARNEEAEIENCLRSLLALDYDNYEVVAVNDRSTDRTGEIMEGVAKDPHPSKTANSGPPKLNVIH